MPKDSDFTILYQRLLLLWVEPEPTRSEMARRAILRKLFDPAGEGRFPPACGQRRDPRSV